MAPEWLSWAIFQTAPRDCRAPQDGTAATGEGFQWVVNYVEQSWPKMILIENVTNLAKDGEDTYIKSQLESRGYWVAQVELEASQYGSPVHRERLFFLCFRTDWPANCRGYNIWVSLLRETLSSSCVDMQPLDRFIVFCPTVRAAICKQLDFPIDDGAVQPKPTSDKAGCRDEHFEMFRAKGLSWPVEVMDDELHGFKLHTSGLSQRQVELIHFCHQIWEPQDDQPLDFLDVNMSLGKLTNYIGKGIENMKNPWRTTLATLIGSTVLVVRIFSDQNCEIRQLEPWEYFGLIGWSLTMWPEGCTDRPSKALCSNMAGNAFSGYIVSPLAVAFLAAVGATIGMSGDELKELENQPTDATAGSGDDEDDEQAADSLE